MTNKLVIRRLPPSIGEEEFLKQVSPLPEYDYFCFFEANTSLGSHAFSRAYINFINPEDMAIFKEQFDNYVFLDRNGQEYPAVVEQSLWHKVPKDGPFHRPPATLDSNEENKMKVLSGLEEDEDFIEFVQKIKGPKRKSQQSPIQTLETNLDAITNASISNATTKSGKSKVVTPLIGYVNQKRQTKNSKKSSK